MGDWRLNIIISSGEQKVEKPTDDEDVVKILDRINGKNERGCLSCFCKKKYVLEEDVRTNRINEKKEKDRHSDSKLSHGNSEEDDYNKS